MANDEDFEEDVVIEGSELYNVLKDIGCTNFESIPVIRTEFLENWDEIKNSKEVHTSKFKFLLDTCQRITDIFWRSEVKGKMNGAKEMELILQLEPLLDDHSLSIQNMLKDSSDRRSLKSCPAIIISSSLLGLSLFSRNSRIPGVIIGASLSILLIHEKYSGARSLKNLKDLISVQNDLFNLKKKSLKILRNGYGIRVDSKKSTRKFTDLEIERLKLLQPLCEILTKSMEQCSKIFYRTSTLLADYLPRSAELNNLFTKFEDNSLKISGEINYKVLKQFYYTYILVQSDMMNLLAMIYSENEEYRIRMKLSHIINTLVKKLRIYRKEMSEIVRRYQTSKAVFIHHKSKKIENSKYQDLYMHVDLLSRKLRSAYGKISSILDEIDNHSNNEETEDFIDSLIFDMNEAYRQIDTARNFAEFNSLLINKFRRNRSEGDNLNYINNEFEREKEIRVISDTDPQIIDECFEEYIKEEYLKPLCEDDDVSLERAKMDKLLEENFMSELKAVLMDKYRSMSERESKALLRYRRDKFDGNSDIIAPIPLPPPLPSNMNVQGMEEGSERRPVALPRTIDPALMSDNKRVEDNRIIEPAERFSIKMAIGGRIPAFTTDEETFIGSGENSEEELAGSGCEDDETLD